MSSCCEWYMMVHVRHYHPSYLAPQMNRCIALNQQNHRDVWGHWSSPNPRYEWSNLHQRSKTGCFFLAAKKYHMLWNLWDVVEHRFFDVVKTLKWTAVLFENAVPPILCVYLFFTSYSYLLLPITMAIFEAYIPHFQTHASYFVVMAQNSKLLILALEWVSAKKNCKGPQLQASLFSATNISSVHHKSRATS